MAILITKKLYVTLSKKNKWEGLCTVIHMLRRNQSHEQLHHNGVNTVADAPFLDFALQHQFAVIRDTMATCTIHQRSMKYEICKEQNN